MKKDPLGDSPARQPDLPLAKKEIFAVSGSRKVVFNYDGCLALTHQSDTMGEPDDEFGSKPPQRPYIT
jgi:hypothetical protein